MINTFLKAKHWQLFILMFAIPVFLPMMWTQTMFPTFDFETDPDPMEELREFFDLLKFLPVLIIFASVFFYGWFWSIAIGLQNKVPETVKMKTTKFKIFFFINIIFAIGISWGIVKLSNGILSEIIQDGEIPTPSTSYILSMVGIFLLLSDHA